MKSKAKETKTSKKKQVANIRAEEEEDSSDQEEEEIIKLKRTYVGELKLTEPNFYNNFGGIRKLKYIRNMCYFKIKNSIGLHMDNTLYLFKAYGEYEKEGEIFFDIGIFHPTFGELSNFYFVKNLHEIYLYNDNYILETVISLEPVEFCSLEGVYEVKDKCLLVPGHTNLLLMNDDFETLKTFSDLDKEIQFLFKIDDYNIFCYTGRGSPHFIQYSFDDNSWDRQNAFPIEYGKDEDPWKISQYERYVFLFSEYYKISQVRIRQIMINGFKLISDVVIQKENTFTLSSYYQGLFEDNLFIVNKKSIVTFSPTLKRIHTKEESYEELYSGLTLGENTFLVHELKDGIEAFKIFRMEKDD